MNEEQLEELRKNGISCKCEYVELLREFHITFTKENKHYRRVIPVDKLIDYFGKTYVDLIIQEAEYNLLDH